MGWGVCVRGVGGGCGSGGGVMGVGGRWREGSRGCIKYAWKSKKNKFRDNWRGY